MYSHSYKTAKCFCRFSHLHMNTRIWYETYCICIQSWKFKKSLVCQWQYFFLSALHCFNIRIFFVDACCITKNVTLVVQSTTDHWFIFHYYKFCKYFFIRFSKVNQWTPCQHYRTFVKLFYTILCVDHNFIYCGNN